MQSTLVKINVGGRVFQVSEDVLRSRGENMISRMLHHSNKSSMNTNIDKEGNLFIDGNADAFAAILDFLRLGKLHIPYNLSWSKMQAELDYYCIDVSQAEVDKSVFDSKAVSDELYKAAVDSNFGSKLQEITARYNGRLAKQWMDANKKALIEKLVEAATQGFSAEDLMLPLNPVQHCAEFSTKDSSSDFVKTLNRMIESDLGVQASILKVKASNGYDPASIMLSVSWKADSETAVKPKNNLKFNA